MSQRYTSLRDGTPVVEIDATSGNETHTLTSGFTPGRQYIAMRLDGSANTVTVQAENGDALNGTTNGSVAVPPRESVTFDRLDAAWRTVGFGGAEQGSGASIADGSITANKLGADVPAALAPDIATELDLGAAASLNVGTAAGTVAAGNDSRIVGALQAANNLADVGSASAARTSLQLGAAATLAVGTAAGTVAAGDDARLSDQRVPTDGSVTFAKLAGATPAALASNSAFTGAYESKHVLIEDSFNRADSAATLGTSTSGHAWTALVGTWGTSSNKGYVAAGTGYNVAVIDTGLSNVELQVTIAGTSTVNTGLAFRYASAGNGYYCVFNDSGNVRIYKGASGTYTMVAGASVAQTVLTGDVMRVSISGATFKVYRNGTLILTATDGSSPYTAQTMHGMWGWSNSGAATRSFENFSISTPSVARVTYADTLTPATLVPRPVGVDMRDYGIVNDGATNNGPMMLQALTRAKNSKVTVPFSLSSDPQGTVSIFLPAGDYVVTDIGGLLGQEAMTAKIASLRFVGEGPGLTRIIFNPASPGALCTNDYWLNVQFEGISFYNNMPGSTFFHCNTTHNAQRFKFISCTWTKWKYGIYLEGNNNNSELFFLNCHNSGMETDGAFLRIPTTGADQFLNYWFYGCTHWSTSAPFIEADKGGHFKIYGLDVSDWGTALTSTGDLFKIRGASHAQGVCSLIVDGLRVEAKNAFCSLLYSEWPQGNVDFRGVDWSSQVGTYTYGDTIRINYTNVSGPRYSFRDSNLAGGVNVSFGSNDWQHYHHILFDNCEWHQKTRPSDVVTYSAGVNPAATPPVEFRRCRSRTGSTGDVTSTDGAYTWDATIGYRGQLMQTLTERTLSLRALTGVLSGASTLKFRLPVGAIITSFHVLSPAGGTAEADGGSWTLETTEGTPTTVATVTVADALSAGYTQETVLSPPYLCSTADKSNFRITATNVANGNASGLMLVKGYW